MKSHRSSLAFSAVLAVSLTLSPGAHAHFIWLEAEPGSRPGQATIRLYFNEAPVPDSDFVKFVREGRLEVEGQLVPSRMGGDGREASWVGRLPLIVDSERDMGVSSRGDTTFHLVYTARCQTAPVAANRPEALEGLRVRMIEGSSTDQIEVNFQGKPLAGARLRLYPHEGAPREDKCDDRGRATVAGLSAGKVALWANHVEKSPGKLGEKSFTETRHYATLTFTPVPARDAKAAPATTFATMPAPAVTSFGGAVVGQWLYVYGGHVGKTHRYNVETTSRHFRRLNLADGTTWEDLPMGPDLQGVALVTDGKSLYRVGGMAARNKPTEEQDMYSVADFARFDIETRRWENLPPMPQPRSTHDAAVVGRTLYVVGGWTMKGASEDSEFPDHALAIDLDRPTSGWRVIPQPFRRRALAAAAHKGKLYVLGGLAESDGMKVERRVDVFDPARQAWSRGPDLPAGSRAEGFGSSAYELDGRLYVSGASGRISRLNEAGEGWEAVGAWSLPRITHRLLPAPAHTLLAVGGSARGETTPVIESVRLESLPVESTQRTTTQR
ncbi:MAG: galactose oxidase [Isosphaeraceae bacterium]